MLWKVVAITQSTIGKINSEFLIEAREESSIRNLLQQHQMIIVSLEKFLGTIQEFGTIQLRLKSNNNTSLEIITKEPFHDTIINFFAIGFNVTHFNDRSKPLSDETIQQTLQSAKNDYQKKQHNYSRSVNERTDQQQKKYKDQEKSKMITIVQKTIEDIEEMKKNELDGVSQTNIDQLNQLEADLRVVKMGSNKEKITQLLEKIFGLMETIETEHLDAMKEQEKQIFMSSSVSNVDVKGELDKFKKAQVVSDAGVEKSANDKYYAFFGKIGIYQKFIKKDFFNSFENLNSVLYDAVSLVTFSIILILVIIGATFFINNAMGTSFNTRLLLVAIHLGSLGIGNFLAFGLGKKNILMTLIQIIVAILTYFLISTLIVMNFALI